MAPPWSQADECRCLGLNRQRMEPDLSQTRPGLPGS